MRKRKNSKEKTSWGKKHQKEKEKRDNEEK